VRAGERRLRERGRRVSAGARARTWAVGIAFLVAATGGAFALGRLVADAVLLPATLAREGAPEVPDLVGRPLEEARRRAEDAGVGLDVLGVAYSDRVDSGEVLVQHPAEDLALEPGKPIEVLISAGPGGMRVPDVRGLSQAAAVEMLRIAGIPVAGVRRAAGDGIEAGSVVSTAPPIGAAIEPGDSLTLAVSRGGTVVEVPDLVGKTADEARAVLRSVGLAPRWRPAGPEESDGGAGDGDAAPRGDVPDGVVLAQDPPGGGLARTGGSVTLRIGPRQGPE
jgi:serine/threonine-protein kinase